MRPTSKVIQISTSPFPNKIMLTVLCEDGSIWDYNREGFKEWNCILNRAAQLQEQAVTNNN